MVRLILTPRLRRQSGTCTMRLEASIAILSTAMRQSPSPSPIISVKTTVIDANMSSELKRLPDSVIDKWLASVAGEHEAHALPRLFGSVG